MRRAFHAVVGAALAAFLAFLIGSGISQYQVRVLLYSPDQAASFIDAFLIVWPIIFILGGWLGYHASKPKT